MIILLGVSYLLEKDFGEAIWQGKLDFSEAKSKILAFWKDLSQWFFFVKVAFKKVLRFGLLDHKSHSFWKRFCTLKASFFGVKA
jgi:hypothetical protein